VLFVKNQTFWPPPISPPKKKIGGLATPLAVYLSLCLVWYLAHYYWVSHCIGGNSEYLKV